MTINEFRQQPELRQQIVHAAHSARNATLWRLLGQVYSALTAQPKRLRKSRWLAVHHGW